MKTVKLKFKKEEIIEGVFDIPDEMYNYLKAFHHYDITQYRSIEKFDNKFVCSKVNEFLNHDLFKNFKHYNTQFEIKNFNIEDYVDKRD